MKFPRLAYLIRNRGNLLAIFGEARLMRTVAGRIELHGGSPDDRRAAREWCSLFRQKAVIEVASQLDRRDATHPLHLHAA